MSLCGAAQTPIYRDDFGLLGESRRSQSSKFRDPERGTVGTVPGDKTKECTSRPLKCARAPKANIYEIRISRRRQCSELYRGVSLHQAMKQQPGPDPTIVMISQDCAAAHEAPMI